MAAPMKILFIGAGKGVDYLSDVIFHGLKTLYKKDVYENTDHWYLFAISEEKKKTLYGRGFTICGTLSDDLKNVITADQIKKQVKDRFFDYIVYGSIWRAHDYFPIFQSIIQKKK
jgi:6-pyruvoyl-tetrahydropterin synthase